MQPDTENTQKTVRNSEEYSTRIFLFALELIPCFALPAIIGYFVNDWVSGQYPGLGMPGTIGIFATAYTFSWAVVIARYRSITRSLKQ